MHSVCHPLGANRSRRLSETGGFQCGGDLESLASFVPYASVMSRKDKRTCINKRGELPLRRDCK
jgi:hypothetical protein